MYSLGAILYECVTGRPMYEGTLPEVYRKIQEESPPPPNKLDSRISRDLSVVCQRALARNPKDRYASAEALAKVD